MKIEDRWISVSIGRTVKVRDFEAFRIDFGIEGNIPSDAELEEEYDKARDFIEKKMKKIIIKTLAQEREYV